MPVAPTPRDRLESLAAWTPAFILTYVALQLTIRLSISPNLEVDESQFVGATDLRMNYGNSHPPLYNWVVAGCLGLFASWPAAVAVPKHLMLAATYLLTYDTGRRLGQAQGNSGRVLGASMAASLLLLPQVVWQSQVTLAHSVLVTLAVVATLHALVLILLGGGPGAFLWLGLAAGVGAMAKYNYLLSLFVLLIACASIAPARRAVFRPALLLSGAVFLLLFGPHAIWAATHLSSSTQRLDKLYVVLNPFWSRVDIPYVGVDGFITLILGTLASAAPLAVLWVITHRRAGPATPAAPDSPTAITAKFARRSVFLGMAAFAIVVLAADVHTVRERYLTPLLVPMVVWLAAGYPIDHDRRIAAQWLSLCATVALVVTIAWPLTALGRKSVFTFPFDALARDAAPLAREPVAILAHRQDTTGNLVIRTPGSTAFEPGAHPPRVLMVWLPQRGESAEVLEARLGDGYVRVGDELAASHPYAGLTQAGAAVHLRLYERAK